MEPANRPLASRVDDRVDGTGDRTGSIDVETTVAGQRRILTELRCTDDWADRSSVCLTSNIEMDSTDENTSQAPTDNPIPDGLRRADSLVIVNTGNGKGKSSSAFGMMVRALARDWNVAVVQFIKSGNWNVGEEKMGRRLGVDWHAFGDGFTWNSDDLANDRAHDAAGWAKAKEILHAGDHQLVIFDELTYLSTYGWLDISEVVTAIADRPRHVNVIVTGRDAAPELVDIADTVTEMREVKHAYTSGVRAMRGIDY